MFGRIAALLLRAVAVWGVLSVLTVFAVWIPILAADGWMRGAPMLPDFTISSIWTMVTLVFIATAPAMIPLLVYASLFAIKDRPISHLPFILGSGGTALCMAVLAAGASGQYQTLGQIGLFIFLVVAGFLLGLIFWLLAFTDRQRGKAISG